MLSDERFRQICQWLEMAAVIDPDTLEPIEVARNEYGMARTYLTELVQAMQEANAPDASAPAQPLVPSIAQAVYEAHRSIDEGDADDESPRTQHVAFAREAIDAHCRTVDVVEKINGTLLATMETASQTIRAQAAHIEELTAFDVRARTEEMRRLNGELTEAVTRAHTLTDETTRGGERWQAKCSDELLALEDAVVGWIGDVQPSEDLAVTPYTSATDRLIRLGITIRERRKAGGAGA